MVDPKLWLVKFTFKGAHPSTTLGVTLAAMAGNTETVPMVSFVQPETTSLEVRITLKFEVDTVDKLVKLLPNGIIESTSTTGFTQTSNPTMTISGYDISKNILNEKPNSKDKTTNRKLKGSDIIDIIESKYNSSSKDSSKLKRIEDKTKEFPTRVTKNSQNTYGDILSEQAKKIGWTYFITRNKINYVNSRKKMNPTKSFEWGKDLIEFVPQINTTDISPGFIIRSSSPTSNKSIMAEAKTGSEDVWDDKGIKASELAKKMKKQIKDEQKTISDKKECEIIAKANLNNLSDNLLTGTGKVVGTTDLEIGQMLKLERLGRFSGNYFITNVKNSISSGGYITTFSVRTNVIQEVKSK